MHIFFYSLPPLYYGTRAAVVAPPDVRSRELASLRDPAAFLRVSAVSEGLGEGEGRLAVCPNLLHQPLFASVRVIRRSQMSQFSDTAVSRVGPARETVRPARK